MSVLHQSIMSHIKDDGLQSNYYPVNNQIASTDDWLIIYTHITPSCGQLWQLFIANNMWRQLQCTNLPDFFEHVSLFIIRERLLILHGTTNGLVYTTFMGDLSSTTVNFEVIGVLRMNRVADQSRHQLAWDGGVNLYIVHGYRISIRNLTVYKLEIWGSEDWVMISRGPGPDGLRSTRNSVNPSPENRVIYSYKDNGLIVSSVIKHCNRLLDSFYRLFMFDLQSARWNVIFAFADQSVISQNVSLAPVPEFFPAGFPMARHNAGYGLAVYDRRYVFLTGGQTVASWETWVLDLNLLVWSLTPADGPLVASNEWLSVTVTPNGRLYADRSRCMSDEERNVATFAHEERADARGGRVYGMLVQDLTEDEMYWQTLLTRHGNDLFTGDLSDRALYVRFGLNSSRLAARIRYAHTGVYERQ